MPIYEYKCTNCGYKFDELQKITDEPLCVCPKCQQPHLEKLVSASNFHLKGGGWYKTDYKATSGKDEKVPTSASSAPKSAKEKTVTKDPKNKVNTASQ